jgi:hypothetical protein
MAFLSRDSWDSRAGVPKSRPAGLSGLWIPITLRAGLGSKCGLKQSCSSRRELFNDMSHVVCSQVFWVDSRLLVVGSQNWQTLGNSTPGPSFGHNLCFRCPNEQCKTILDIYASRAFHWYKERHKPLRFDPSNRSPKFRESTGTPSPQSGSCLGSVRVHSLTLSYTPGSSWCDSRASLWPAPLQPLFALVASPKLGLRHLFCHLINCSKCINNMYLMYSITTYSILNWFLIIMTNIQWTHLCRLLSSITCWSIYFFNINLRNNNCRFFFYKLK